MKRSRFCRDLSIVLRSERDRSVDWYLLYNANITGNKTEKREQKLTSQREKLPLAKLFLSTAATIITAHAKSYKFSTISIHSVLKLNLSRISLW